jgi:hypothetical protein
MTSDTPPKHNIQVQINYEAGFTTFKRIAPVSVSIALVPSDSSWTAKQIRDALIEKIAV